MLAKDAMTSDVVTARPDTTVTELARRLLNRRISALPVTDTEGCIVGIVSEGDLLRRRELGTEQRHSWWLEVFGDPDALARDYAKAHGLTAADIMTNPVMCVEETAPLAAVANILETHAIKRVPVLRDGKLVGIISRADLMRAFVAIAAPAPPGSADDRAIERALRARLNDESWARGAMVNLVVDNGVVALCGFARSDEHRRALRVLAKEIPGVRAIDDRLVIGNFVMAT
jgi:CBS domain-containing protein